VGVMGVLQALEAIKLIVNGKLTADVEKGKGIGNSMLLFSANGNPQFRGLRMRSRNVKCVACSATSELTLERLQTMDYTLFCGLALPINVLNPDERVEAKEYDVLRKGKHLLVDVREKIQYDICNLEGSINVPFSTFEGGPKDGDKPSWLREEMQSDAPIYIVCRRGNDSQIVARKLKESGLNRGGSRKIKDIEGGWDAWKKQVDSTWPEY
jgi:adenylyltransferase/sulfurtransferase